MVKRDKTKEKIFTKKISSNSTEKNKSLILHNDEINTFEYVIDMLIKNCNHSIEQAEQCAYITHYKGKCDIKTGSFDALKHIKDELSSKGLSVTIE